MRTLPRWAVGAFALSLLVACTPGQAPSATAPVISPAATSAAPAGETITVSAVPGLQIDRPTLPDPGVRPAGFAAAPSGEGLSGYQQQRLNWRTCGGDYQCAKILAPLDYADPSAQAITLSLAKKPATKSPKLGTLFVNPGGPGASGRNLVPYFNSAGLEQYDILGWDPRGSNDSTPVRCMGPKETDAYNQLDSSPDDAAETDALIIGSYEFGTSCWESSGDLLEHISTVDTVRDLDLMRALVRDERLNFLGYSYGTQIGAVYADLFPQRTGHLVLDAAVDITDDDSVIQAMGFDLALNNFAAWCARRNCDLGSTKDAVLKATTELLDSLDSGPLTVGNRRLTQSLAATGIAQYLYGGIPDWRNLAGAMHEAINGDGTALLSGADGQHDRQRDGTYGSFFYSFPAIACADSTDEGVVEAEQRWAEDQKKAPIFGKYFGLNIGCALWPVRSQVQFKPTGSGAAPLLVIGATGDPATPYQHAVTMAQQLESGVLVTYKGEGHSTFGGKSACVDSIVVAYLTKGTVPQDGVTCQ